MPVDGVDNGQRIGNVGAAPAGAVPGDLEIASGRRFAAAHPDAGRLHVKELARLMLAKYAGDMVVDDDHLVGMAVPLLGEHADGGRAAADPHAFFHHIVDPRRLARLQQHLRAALDLQFGRLLVAQRQHHLAGDVAFLLAAAGEMTHPAQRQHLRAVFRSRHMADLLAIAQHRGPLRADIAVGVDLHLQPAIAEDALGDDGHHVDAVMPAGHDEGRRFVVRIGGTRADAGQEGLAARQDVAVPVPGVRQEGHDFALVRQGLVDHGHRIDPRQPPIPVGVAVAGAGASLADAAQHGTGVAYNDAVLLTLAFFVFSHGLLP